MNWLKPTTVKVKALRLPGDIQQRKGQPHVIELAESIRERTGGRPIHLPTVEYPSMSLIAGRDRVAALLLNGARSIEVQLVSQVTEKERRDLERDENIHRRVDDRDALIRQRVDEREAEIEESRRDVPPEPKPGRPKTARGEAREQVARELGTTPDAVRVAEARAVAEELPNKSSETQPPLPPPVETYGLPLVSDVEAQELRDVQAAIDEADHALRRAQAALRRVEGVPLFRGVSQLLAQVHGVGVEVRRARPTAVCPYCKRLPGMVGLCRGCNGSAFVSADALLGIADELKLGGAQAMVTQQGRLVPYSQAAESKAAAPAKTEKPAKKIRVEFEGPPAPAPPADPEISEEDIPF